VSAAARTLALAAALVLWGASQAEAQVMVVVGGPPAVACLPPPPVYNAPRVAYYSAPAPPATVYYGAPPVTYYAGPVVARTRYGLFGRPRATTYYYP
jgi:hypothetical protein